MSDKTLHATRLELLPALPAEVSAGARLTPRVRLICPFGCSLKGETVRVASTAGTDCSPMPLVVFRSGASETEAMTIEVPTDATELTVQLAFDGAEGDVADHAPCVAELNVPLVDARVITTAVWGLPSSVVVGQPFAFHVGAKSSAGTSLAGARIKIWDSDGRPAGSARLGDRTWPGADDLYWAEVTVRAPHSAGRFNWSISFDGGEDGPAYTEARQGFSFATMHAPEYTLTVSVVDEESGAALENAELRLRTVDTSAATIAGKTDTGGIAMMAVPSGTFELAVWKPNYRTYPATVVVKADQAVTVTAKFNPKKKPQQVWM